MPHVSKLLATTLLLSAAALAQPSNGLLSGFTVRFHGGLDHMSGLEDLNNHISGMNAYFGQNGTWVTDAQGENVNVGNWAPYLRVKSLKNRPDMGLTVERTWISWPHSRLVAGLEYTAGATATSNLFRFSIGTGFTPSIFAEERVDVSNVMATCRYSLKDLNLPLHAHVGLGLGLGNIESTGTYIQKSNSFFETDPLFNKEVIQHSIDAAYDGSALTGRLFLGTEVELGPVSLFLDLGYNHMNFDKLDGETTQLFRSPTGEMVEVPLAGEPDTRYEFAPLISASLQYQRDNALRQAIGLPPFSEPLDLNDPDLQWGAPKPISYNLSGGYARFSIGYRF